VDGGRHEERLENNLPVLEGLAEALEFKNREASAPPPRGSGTVHCAGFWTPEQNVRYSVAVGGKPDTTRTAQLGRE